MSKTKTFSVEEKQQRHNKRMKQRMDPKHPLGRAMRPHGPHGFDRPFGPVKE